MAGPFWVSARRLFIELLFTAAEWGGEIPNGPLRWRTCALAHLLTRKMRKASLIVDCAWFQTNGYFSHGGPLLVFCAPSIYRTPFLLLPNSAVASPHGETCRKRRMTRPFIRQQVDEIPKINNTKYTHFRVARYYEPRCRDVRMRIRTASSPN
jgi:hypothetical protein